MESENTPLAGEAGEGVGAEAVAVEVGAGVGVAAGAEVAQVTGGVVGVGTGAAAAGFFAGGGAVTSGEEGGGVTVRDDEVGETGMGEVDLGVAGEPSEEDVPLLRNELCAVSITLQSCN